MKKILLGLFVAVVAVGIAVPVALAGGGNSDAANACKQGGWQNLVRQDGTDFKNQGDCVSYATKGGVLKAKSTGGSAPVLALTVDGKTSTEVTTTETVLYAGTFTNAMPNATVGLTVFNGFGCTGAVAYNAASYTTTDASGKYSEMSGLTPVAGLYSSRTNVGSNLSNCVDIAVKAPAVDEFALSLAITPNTVPAGTDVTFAGTLTNLGSTPVLGAVVTVTAYSTDSTCTTPVGWGPFTATVDASGHYATAPAPTTGAPAGVYYYKASSMGVVSGCEHFTIA